LRDVDGRLRKAKIRLATETGITNPKRAERQPPMSAMKPITGAPTIYDRDEAAIIQPTAFALFSKGKCSPIRVRTIGKTIAIPTPLREYNVCITLKVGARKQPKAEMLTQSNPTISNDLCLNRTLRMLMSNPNITATTLEIVLICPMAPTET